MKWLCVEALFRVTRDWPGREWMLEQVKISWAVGCMQETWGRENKPAKYGFLHGSSAREASNPTWLVARGEKQKEKKQK